MESGTKCKICRYHDANLNQLTRHVALQHEKIREFIPKEEGDALFTINKDLATTNNELNSQINQSNNSLNNSQNTEKTTTIMHNNQVDHVSPGKISGLSQNILELQIRKKNIISFSFFQLWYLLCHLFVISVQKELEPDPNYVNMYLLTFEIKSSQNIIRTMLLKIAWNVITNLGKLDKNFFVKSQHSLKFVCPLFLGFRPFN